MSLDITENLFSEFLLESRRLHGIFLFLHHSDDALLHLTTASARLLAWCVTDVLGGCCLLCVLNGQR